VIKQNFFQEEERPRLYIHHQILQYINVIH